MIEFVILIAGDTLAHSTLKLNSAKLSNLLTTGIYSVQIPNSMEKTGN
jgi:hypothetical protein